MENQLISVIIPVHNSQDYLHHCVESIRRQTYSPIEIILVENGSTDKSYELCRKYASIDARIKVLNMDQAGVSAARNEGIKAAKGTYLVFADSDDYCDARWIENLWNLQMKERGEYIPVCGITVVKNYMEYQREVWCYSEQEKQSIVDKSNFLAIYDRWLINSPVNKLYVKDILIQENVFMPINMDLGEDLLFNLEYIDKSNKKGYVVDNQGLYYYVKNRDTSLTTQWRIDRFKIESFLNTKIKEYCVKVGIADYTILNKLIYYSYRDMMIQIWNLAGLMSYRDKLRYNNMILASQEFQEAIRQYQDEIEHLVWVAYKSKNYAFLQVIEMLERYKNNLKQKVNRKIRKSNESE